jgi:predicted permease
MREDEALDRELRFHIDARVDDLVAEGVTIEEAHRRARLEFGGVMQTKEAVRDLGAWSLVNGLVQDLRLAFRTLRATPVVTAVAVLSLALGIGANTAIFSLVNSLVLRALPVRQPQRLTILADTTSNGSQSYTYAIWQAVHQRTDLFDTTFAWCFNRFNLSSGGETEFADGYWASGTFFDGLGVTPLLGRTFTDADDVRGGGPDGPVAVISYSFWQRRFGGAADVIGHTLNIERIPFTIVGVTSPEFFGPEVGRAFDVVVPIGAEPLFRGKESALENRWYWWLTVMARLKPGQSVDAGTAGLRGVQSQIREAAVAPDANANGRADFLKEPFLLTPAGTGDSTLRRRYQQPLVTILVVVALVLLIACANIANLLLARAAARRHELSVRLALGASRWRLARQLLAESVVLAGTGAAVGLLIARWASQLLVGQLSTQTNHVFLDLGLDWRVLAFTIGVSVATALLFGTAPAFRAGHIEPVEAIKEHGRGTAGDARIGVASGLVIAQVALSLILVVAAGLFVRTFSTLANRHLGFERDGVLIVSVNAQHAQIPAAERLATYDRVREHVRALPGVADAALSVIAPVTGQGWNDRVVVSEAPRLPERQSVTFMNGVTPTWFATFRTPLVAGRTFTDHDLKTSAPVAIVNEAFARKFLNGNSPIGHTMQPPAGWRSPEAPKEIVGVVADAAYRNVREAVPATTYIPLPQIDETFKLPSIYLIVRSASGSSALLTKSIAAAIATTNPDLALTFRSLTDQVDASLTQERIVAILAGFFGALALLLAGLGLYGVTSYAVSRRRAEIGIRLALGATPGGVVRLVLARVTILVTIGVAVGAGLSVWASKFVATLLYGLEPRDPVTLVGAAVTLAAVGAMAGWLPAHRASRIDPAAVLRAS